MHSLNIPDEELREILEKIRSDESPVGIDAAKTHALILYMLQRMERRLESLEMKFFEEEEE